MLRLAIMIVLATLEAYVGKLFLTGSPVGLCYCQTVIQSQRRIEKIWKEAYQAKTGQQC